MTAGWVSPSNRELVRRNSTWIVLLLAIAASITSITNGFAFDDVKIILENESVHSLERFWRFFNETYWPEAHYLYRPLTMLAFAVQWAIGNGSPLPFHIVNVALFLTSCVTFHRMMKQVVDEDVSLVAAMLFAVHPVHTEVVANIVGQSELVVAIVAFVSVERYITTRRRGSVQSRDILLLCGLYLIGCLFKENAIVLPALIIAVELILNPARDAWRGRVKGVAPLAVCALCTAICFIAVRTYVANDFKSAGVNELFAGAPFAPRLYTMLGIMTEWARLFVWPAHLSADYSFPRTKTVISPDLMTFAGVLIIVTITAIALRLRRSTPLVLFCVAWLAITLAIPSNIILVTGFVLAERSLFLASAAVVTMLAFAIVAAWRGVRDRELISPRIATAVLALVLVTGVVRSSNRNGVWRDNETLFFQTVLDVPMSARAHWMLAEHLSKTGRGMLATVEMSRAVALGRRDDGLMFGVAAEQFHKTGMCSQAVPLYERAIALIPDNDQLRSNAALCLIQLDRAEDARRLVAVALEKRPKSAPLDKIVAMTDSISEARRVASAQ